METVKGLRASQETLLAQYQQPEPLLHIPCAAPTFAGLNHVERVMPELRYVEFPAHLQVWALKLIGHPFTDDFERLMDWLSGHVPFWRRPNNESWVKVEVKKSVSEICGVDAEERPQAAINFRASSSLSARS